MTPPPLFWPAGFFIFTLSVVLKRGSGKWPGAAGQGQPLFVDVQKHCGNNFDCETWWFLCTAKTVYFYFQSLYNIPGQIPCVLPQGYLKPCRAVVQKLASPFFIHSCLLIFLQNFEFCGIGFSLVITWRHMAVSPVCSWSVCLCLLNGYLDWVKLCSWWVFPTILPSEHWLCFLLYFWKLIIWGNQFSLVFLGSIKCQWIPKLWKREERKVERES